MATHEQELREATEALDLVCAELAANHEELELYTEKVGISHIKLPMRKAYLELRNKHLREVGSKLSEKIKRKHEAVAWEARTR
jgi:hypothetical protein